MTEVQESKKATPKRVKDVIQSLSAFEQMLRKLEGGAGAAEDIGRMTRMLKPLGNRTLEDLERILKNTPAEKGRQISEERLRFLSKVELQQLADSSFRSSLSRDELALVAQRELGISKWRLLKTSRQEMDKTIQNALENLETLNTIADQASRQE